MFGLTNPRFELSLQPLVNSSGFFICIRSVIYV